VTERKAHAQGVRKQNEALAGSGGTALVKIAEARTGKGLVFLPAGSSGVGVQTLNMNQLLQAITAQQAAQATSPAEKPAERAR
jgi:hypothetical protein